MLFTVESGGMLSFMPSTDNAMISGLLIDFGGTLDSDGGHWLDRFWALYAQMGFTHLSKDTIKEAFYLADARAEAEPGLRTAGFRQMMERHVGWQFEKLGLKDERAQHAMAEAFYRPSERILHRNRNILERLAQDGQRMVVLSNFYGNVQALCEEAGFCEHLEGILDSAIVGIRKPDPAFFLKGLDILNLPASRVAMVGDSFERDMIPAKKLGLTTIWMVGDSRRQAPQPGVVDHVLRSLEDLPTLVKSA